MAASTTVVLAVSTVGGSVQTAAAPAAAPQPSAAAPGAPGHKATWTESDKTGFGTSRTRGSNVWFTLERGRTSEVFYPNLSTPSVRSLELVVTGKGFTGTKTVRMDLSPGQWKLFSAANEQGSFAFFVVTKD